MKVLALVGLLIVTGSVRAESIDIDMFIGSKAPGGGALTLAYGFCRPVVATRSLSAGGITRWTATQPGFNALATSRPGTIYVLRDTTPIEVEITAIDPGLGLKVGAVVLETVGASALIGNVPNIHVHPEWRLLLPDGEVGERRVDFKLRTGAPGYAESPVYGFTITTDANAPDTCGGGAPTTTLPAGETDRLVPGTQLVLRTSPLNPARKSMTLSFGDAFAPGAVDPTATGGQLRMLSNAAANFEGRHELPATKWRLLRGRGAPRGYRYRDPRGTIRSVVIRFGKGITVTGSGIGLAHTLADSPLPVDVAFAIGAQRACLQFGGTVTFKAGKMFRAVNAPSPIACAP